MDKMALYRKEKHLIRLKEEIVADNWYVEVKNRTRLKIGSHRLRFEQIIVESVA